MWIAKYIHMSKKMNPLGSFFKWVKNKIRKFQSNFQCQPVLCCLAMRSKTKAQLRRVASRWQRWRVSFPWLLVGEHGLVCSTCQRAGLDTTFARGEGSLELLGICLMLISPQENRVFNCVFQNKKTMIWIYGSMVQQWFIWGGRGAKTVFRSHVKQHAASRKTQACSALLGFVVVVLGGPQIFNHSNSDYGQGFLPHIIRI